MCFALLRCRGLWIFLAVIGSGCVRAGMSTSPEDRQDASGKERQDVTADGGAVDAVAARLGQLDPVSGPTLLSSTSTIEVAAAQDGSLYLAWADKSAGTWEVYLARWDGKSWAGLAGSDQGRGLSRSDAESRMGSLRVDQAGHPMLVWMDRGPGQYGVFYKQWNGMRWEPLGNSAEGSGLAEGRNILWPVMVLDSLGRQVVAWSDFHQNEGEWGIYLKRWSGSAWEPLDGSASGSGISGPTGAADMVQLAAGPDEQIYAAWQHKIDGRARIKHAVYNGIHWTSLGPQDGLLSSPGVDAGYCHIALDRADHPWVAWQLADDSGIEVIRWDGSTWLATQSAAGSVSIGTTVAQHPRLLFDGRGLAFITWDAETALGRNIYLRSWDGAYWVEPNGWATGGGVSKSSGTSAYPHLVEAPTGVLLQWEETDVLGVHRPELLLER